MNAGIVTRSGYIYRVEAGSNTSTVALRVVGGDERGTQCLRVQLCHSVPRGYKYVDQVLQDGEVSNLNKQNLVISPAGIEPENDCAGEDQQQ
jgi:hypothetical protein